MPHPLRAARSSSGSIRSCSNRQAPRPGSSTCSAAAPHFEARLATTLAALRPAYIYERLCLGNYVGARLSQALRIPYIVEYNGSELSMRRSFQGDRFVYESEFDAIEQAAFAQATLISVVSDIVRQDLIARGVDPAKILVNPNGVDPAAYAPPLARSARGDPKRARLARRERVVCFTGTFGGWHGVDVLAAAMPQILRGTPAVRFLMIGDGIASSHLIDSAVQQSGIAAQRAHDGTRAAGRRRAAAPGRGHLRLAAQQSHGRQPVFRLADQAVRIHGAAAAALSPATSSRLAEVLSPALTPGRFRRPAPAVGSQRARAVHAGRRRRVRERRRGSGALSRCGPARSARNARAGRGDALFAGKRTSDGCATFIGGERTDAAVDGSAASTPLQRIETGDAYKDQVQHQWNNNPVGLALRQARAARTRWSGFSKSRRTATAITRRGCRR